MFRYVTHQFAHPETLDRAERWLLQLGFEPGQIETHREGLPWITVLAAPGRAAEAEVVFNVAERTDPSGWPSFWELAGMPHAAIPGEPSPLGPEMNPLAPHRAPVAWHPIDASPPAESSGLAHPVRRLTAWPG